MKNQQMATALTSQTRSHVDYQAFFEALEFPSSP